MYVEKMKAESGRLRLTGRKLALFHTKEDEHKLAPFEMHEDEEVDITLSSATKLEDFSEALAHVFTVETSGSGGADSANPACTPRRKHSQEVGPQPSDPELISHAEAEYTDAARFHRVNASVNIGVIISKSGVPADLCMLSSPAGYGLDQSALNAVSAYRFRPAMLNGQPVESKVTIEVVFKIF